jgi:hypothetical protein
MADDDRAEVHKGSTPPYIAFQTLKTVLASFKPSGAPDRLDRSVLSSFSGAVGGQIITSLRFLKLIDEGGHPLPSFQPLIDSYGTDRWQEALASLLRKEYRPIFALNLETASPAQFNERFRTAFPAKEETLRKCITFFLNGAREAGIGISPFIMKNKKPRSSPAKKRVPRTNGGVQPDLNLGDRATPPPPPADKMRESERTPYQILFEEIYDAKTMTVEEEAAVFALLRYLKRRDRGMIEGATLAHRKDNGEP